MKRKTRPAPPDEEPVWLPQSYYDEIERRNDEMIGPPKIDYYLVGIVCLGFLLVIAAVIFVGRINGG